jgi:hypothetical protein
MVKKVIDIFPPENPLLKQKEEALLKYDNDGPLQIAMAAEEAEPETYGPKAEPEHEPVSDGKPKMTYISAPDLVEEKQSIFQSSEKKSWVGGMVFKLVLGVVVVLLAMYGLDLRFAKAVVKIWPETSDLSQNVKVAVDPTVQAVDETKNLIPGFNVAVEETVKGSSPATGQKNVQGKAQGTVKLFNNYTAAQRLVKGTRIQAPLEKFQPALTKNETPWFRTIADVVLDPKSSATVGVVSDNPGEKFNIDPSVFSVPGLVGTAQYTFIYGQSFEKFQGGTQGNAVEVANVDLDNAKTAITSQASAEIKKALENKVKLQGLEIIDSSTEKFNLGDPVITAKVGDDIPKIAAQLDAKASTVAYKKSDLENLGKDFIFGKIPAGSIADDKSLSIKSSYAGIDPVSGQPALTVTGRLMVYAGMPEDDLKKGLSEKGVSEAKIFLMNQPGMKDVQIQLTPPWRFAIPRDLDRIQVQTILN